MVPACDGYAVSTHPRCTLMVLFHQNPDEGVQGYNGSRGSCVDQGLDWFSLYVHCGHNNGYELAPCQAEESPCITAVARSSAS